MAEQVYVPATELKEHVTETCDVDLDPRISKGVIKIGPLRAYARAHQKS